VHATAPVTISVHTMVVLPRIAAICETIGLYTFSVLLVSRRALRLSFPTTLEIRGTLLLVSTTTR
jgi:hypothetical protein